MSNPTVSALSPDKLIKDYQWDYLTKASKYASGILLDVGCGSMPYKQIFIRKVTKYIGVDKYGGYADIKADFMSQKFKSNSYNTVLCTQVLEHTPDPQAMLNKIFRLLKKRGVLIATVPFTGSIHEEPHDYFRYTKYGLQYLIEKAGFKIIYIHEEGNWITAIAQDFIFYLESSYNRYLLKYPKRIIQISIQLLARLLSRLPEKIVQAKKSHINYIVVAKKS